MKTPQRSDKTDDLHFPVELTYQVDGEEPRSILALCKTVPRTGEVVPTEHHGPMEVVEVEHRFNRNPMVDPSLMVQHIRLKLRLKAHGQR